MQVTDLEIPIGFQRWEGDAAEDHIGPFFYRLNADGIETLFQTGAHNANGGGAVHGGVLMTFADYTLCVVAIGDSGESCVTVSCNCEFVSGVLPGALVRGRGEVIRRTGSMVFTRCTLEVDGEVVMTASAVVKRLRPKG